LSEALRELRLSVPSAYAQAARQWPQLVARRTEVSLPAASQPQPVAGEAGTLSFPPPFQVDAPLQFAFADLAGAISEHREPEAVRQSIARGMQLINARYRAGQCAGCTSPDPQSWALVSLAAYASPLTVAADLDAIQEPFWHAYFLVIAAQQVAQPTRVADPTARRVLGREEDDPE
jgi:hypothetical protein